MPPRVPRESLSKPGTNVPAVYPSRVYRKVAKPEALALLSLSTTAKIIPLAVGRMPPPRKRINHIKDMAIQKLFENAANRPSTTHPDESPRRYTRAFSLCLSPPYR